MIKVYIESEATERYEYQGDLKSLTKHIKEFNDVPDICIHEETTYSKPLQIVVEQDDKVVFNTRQGKIVIKDKQNRVFYFNSIFDLQSIIDSTYLEYVVTWKKLYFKGKENVVTDSNNIELANRLVRWLMKT
jgi:formylmethanofuran dehydrogenase subunit D